MREHLEPLLKPAGRLRLLERGDEIRQGAVVDSAPALGGGDRKRDGQVGLADTGGPRKTTFSRRSMKPSSCRLSICSQRIEGWKLTSKSASVLIAGKRLERMAAWSRRLLHSEI